MRARDLSDAARALGRKGGRAGTGKAKRRSVAHYRRTAASLTPEVRAMAVHARRVKAARKMLSAPCDDAVIRERILERWGEDVLREAEGED